jgi:hypothetical protein
MKFKFLNVVLTGLILTVSGLANATIINSTADYTIDLQGSLPGAQMAMAYDPIRDLYYGAQGGRSDAPGTVWDGNGNVVQTAALGVDARAFNYNENTGNLELVTFTSDNLIVGRNGSGLFNGTFTTLLNEMTGSTSYQSMLTYNSNADVFYSMSNSGVVNVVSHTDGTLLGDITLDFSTAGITSFNNYFVGYDSTENVLIATSLTTASIFELDGSFLGSSTIGSSARSNYYQGYTNGQLFVQSTSNGTFKGYDLFADGPTNSVPEPSTLAIFALGMIGLASRRFKKQS